MCLFATLAHGGLTVLGLALVGFICMIMNLVQCCFTYSCYLTLREREIWIYMFLLLAQVLLNTLDILGITDGEGKSIGRLFCWRGRASSGHFFSGPRSS